MERFAAGGADAVMGKAHGRYRHAMGSDRMRQGFEGRFVLLQLGLSVVELDALSAASSVDALPEPLRVTAAERLEREAMRLKRLARARDPRYDLNRHIAVHRTLRWFNGAATPTNASLHQAGACARPHRRDRAEPAAPALPVPFRRWGTSLRKGEAETRGTR